MENYHPQGQEFNSKYDIIPYKSNVNIKYKKMAGLGYLRTNRTQTTLNEELYKSKYNSWNASKRKSADWYV